MANIKSVFDTLEEGGVRNVAVANGQGARVMGVGTGNLNFIDVRNKEVKINLKTVLYVPDLTESLLSVKRLVDMGFKILFKGQVCEISNENAVIATMKNSSSNIYSVTRKHKVLAVKKSEHTAKCQHAWHRRFGHRNPDDVQELKTKRLVTGLKIQDCGIRKVCECCIKGKSSRSQRKPQPGQHRYWT